MIIEAGRTNPVYVNYSANGGSSYSTINSVYVGGTLVWKRQIVALSQTQGYPSGVSVTGTPYYSITYDMPGGLSAPNVASGENSLNVYSSGSFTIPSVSLVGSQISNGVIKQLSTGSLKIFPYEKAVTVKLPYRAYFGDGTTKNYSANSKNYVDATFVYGGFNIQVHVNEDWKSNGSVVSCDTIYTTETTFTNSKCRMVF